GASADSSPVLVVAIHGDSPFAPPHYQYDWARAVAHDNPEVVAVGLLRPGYQDGQGHQSTGVRGLTTGDNYTPEVVDATADGIERLRQLHHARAVVIAGHSG